MKLQRCRVKRIWLKRPEIRGFELEGVMDAQGKPVDYGWHSLGRVFEMVNDRFEMLGIPKLTSVDQVFDRFGPLNGQVEGKPVFTWHNGIEAMIDGEKPRADNGLWNDVIFVPAGWVSSIEATVKEGIVRTEFEGTTYDHIHVDDKPHTIYDVYGFKADGARVLVGNPKRSDLISFHPMPVKTAAAQ
jgi:hypothetical protein